MSVEPGQGWQSYGYQIAFLIGATACVTIALPAIALLASTPAAATELVLMAGENLSSIRTAQQSAISQYIGLIGGVGFNFHISDNLYFESDLQFIQRRYSAGYTIPTFNLPLLAKFENQYVMVGAGPYFAAMISADSDTGQPQTLDALALSTIDFGWVITGGVKLPLTRMISAFISGRLSRALTNSNTSGDSFYWSQAQALLGVQIRIRKARRGY